VNGVLNIDKPSGITSHDVVARVRRIAGLRRVGHAGTLDPDATGVLLVCIGHATRLADLLADQGKVYQARLILGVATSTEDSSGQVLQEIDGSALSRRILEAELPRFTGRILQTPPMVSAVHYGGRRLHELARKGISVERKARPVRIDEIRIERFSPGLRPEAVLTVRCGKGAYVRTLCADLGAALGVGGHIAALRRLSVGKFDIEHAVALEQLADAGPERYLVSASDAVSFLPARVVAQSELADLLHGRELPPTGSFEDGALVRLVDPENELLAIGRVMLSGRIHPEKVFAGAA